MYYLKEIKLFPWYLKNKILGLRNISMNFWLRNPLESLNVYNAALMFFIPSVDLTFCNHQLDWWKGNEWTSAGWYFSNVFPGIARMCNKGAFYITVQLLHILIFYVAVKHSDFQVPSCFRRLKLLQILNQMDHT